MGYANSHKPTMRGMPPQRKMAVNDGSELKCPSFIDLMTGEKIIRIAHPTWLNYLFLLILSAVCLPTAVALFFVKDLFAIVPALMLSALGVLLPVYVTITVLSTVAIITNYRVITKTGIISTRMEEIRIADIRGIKRSRGYWQAIIGVSNLGIGTAATGETEIEIVGIQNANEMIALINSFRPSV